jgi:hypothetical protein
MRHQKPWILIAICFLSPNVLFAQNEKTPSADAKKSQTSVFVEPVTLTEVSDQVGPGLNIGLISSSKRFSDGAQKAGDIYGLNVDLFTTKEKEHRKKLFSIFAQQEEPVIIVQAIADEDWTELKKNAENQKLGVIVIESSNEGDEFQKGYDAIKTARAMLLPRIPKYDQVLPIAFPVSPLPDNFFQPSKFPYPNPLVRVERTAEGFSATAHAHTSCNMVAQTGNMLHRTSSTLKDIFLMGMEGGNLSLKALPGAVDPDKASAVMTSWVLNIEGTNGSTRDILVENDGLDSSKFKPALHAPEEFMIALESWQRQGKITSFSKANHEEVELKDYAGKNRRFKCGMFLVAFDGKAEKPELIEGKDRFGRFAIDFYSTQNFIQQLVEIDNETRDESSTSIAEGGLLTKGGASVGTVIGKPLKALITKMPRQQNLWVRFGSGKSPS